MRSGCTPGSWVGGKECAGNPNTNKYDGNTNEDSAITNTIEYDGNTNTGQTPVVLIQYE